MANPASSTIVDVLRRRAAEHPDREAYTFLANGEHPAATLTYAGLDRRARAVAAGLRERWEPGTPVLMAYSPGLEFVEAFWGCLYARLIAVPAYPPRSGAHAPPRLVSIRDDCGPAGVLTTTDHLESLGEAIPGLRAMATETVPDDAGDGWSGADPRGEDVALLQYSSGSTATPKGIVVSHRNIFANQRMVQEGFRHDERSTFVGWLPFFHDMGLFGNIIHPLFIGARSVLMSPLAFLQKPARWLRAISEYRAHTAGGPDFGYEHCVRRASEDALEGVDLRSWKRAFNGAEKPRPETLRRFTARFGAYGFREEAFYPCYGLAEAVLFVTGRDTVRRPGILLATPDADEGAPLGSRTARAAEHVSSGCTWLEQRVAIVDPETRTPRPDGREGEVWISGPNVAEGYWRNPALTDEVFRARLAGGDGPFLRTGDLGFVRDGELFVTGRSKDLVILRGHNYHPEDLEEAVEGCHPLIGPGQCAAVGIEVETTGGGRREALAVLVELPRSLPPASEMEALAGRAASAVSLRFGVAVGRVVLLPRGSIPKTSSGKVQRFLARSLLLQGELAPVLTTDFGAEGEDGPGIRAPEALRAALAAAPAAGRTPLVREALARRLAAPGGAEAPDGLAEAGLDSLRLVELAQWIEAAFGVSVPLADLFARPSIAALAETIAARLADGSGGTGAGAGTGESPDESGELSLGEAALLYEHEKDPAGSAYNLAFALRLTGALERERLELAVDALLRRHPHLRSVYVRREGGIRRELRDAAPRPLVFVDASGWPEEERVERIGSEAERPFALDEGGVRLVVHRFGPRESVLLVAVHHVLVDLAAAEVILRDLAALYRDDGRGSGEHAPAAGYPAFVRWQRTMVGSPRGEASLAFWRGALAECSHPPRLPPHLRGPSAGGGGGGVHRFRMGEADSRAVAALAETEQATPYMVVLAAYAVLLARFAGEERFVVGTSAAGRPAPCFAGTVGYFANVLPLAVEVPAGASFREVLAAVRTQVARALDHQHLPYPLLVERLGPELGMEREGPVRHALTYGRARHGEAILSLLAEDPAARVPFGPLEAAGFPLGRQMAPFDLTLVVLERERCMDAAFTYAAGRVDGAAVPVLAGAFARLLPLLLRHPGVAIGRLALPPAPDTHPSPPPAHAPRREATGDAGSVVQRLEHHARARPDAVALRSGDACLSYGELNRRAGALGAYLRGRGVGPESVVAIHCPRGIESVVAVLGVLKAGGAYLPVDVAHPAERLRAVVEDAGARLVLTVSTLRDRARGVAECVALDEDGWRAGASPPLLRTAPPAPGQLAYVIYTSGSTGRPKGVGVGHENLAALFDGTRRRFGFGAGDSWVLFHSLAFDFSVWELWGALAHGGTLVVPDQETTRDPVRLAAELAARQVSVLNLTPSAFSNLLPVLAGLPGGAALPLRHVVLGGEAVRFEALDPWFAHPLSRRARLVNMYGITETTVHATWLEARPGQAAGTGSPVGHGLDGVAVRIVGTAREPLPAWAVGEIAVGGTGVARGYLSRPALTARRFVPDAEAARPGARMYLSGDLGYARGDGSVAWMGRADQQVKVRGHRVELGEIEARLRECEGVEWAAVLPDERSEGSASLTAYLTGAPEITVAELRRDLLRALPDYMVPARFVRVPAVPTTVNGKLDVARLRAGGRPLGSGTGFVPPRTPAERTLARIWAEVLAREAVGVDDNYFALGGDSIRSIRIIARAREAGLPLELADLLRGQTIRTLAGALGPAVPEAPAAWAGPFALVPAALRRDLPAGVEDAYPVDRLLQGLLFHSQYSDDYQVYVTSFHVRAPWRPDAMEAALAEVVDRHPFLRTSVHPGPSGEPLQHVWREARVPLSFHDLRGMDEEARAGILARWIDGEKVRTLDWSRPPLLELTLHRRDDRSFQITLREPYLDGWCVALFFRELFGRYLDRCAGAPPPPEPAPRIGQRHFVQLETAALESPATRAFWARYLEGAPASRVARSPRRRSPEALHGRRTEPLPAEVVDGLRAAADRAGIPLKTLLLAVHARLLSVLLGADEVLLGVVLNGRPEEEDGDRAIGSFLNTVPLRVRLDATESWRTFARRILACETEVAPHRRFPLAEMRRLPSPPRFDTVFNFTHFHALEALSGRDDFRILDAYASEQTFFPLTLHFNRSILTGGLELLLDYDATRISPAEIARLAAGALDLLGRVAADAEADGGVGEAGKALEAGVFPAPAGERPSRPQPLPLLAALDRHAATRADAAALAGVDRTITYGGLRRRVDLLADHLAAELGVGPETRVALHAGRAPETIVALLAILRAGGAYVPFDAWGPPARVDFLLEDARPLCVLAERAAIEPLRARGIGALALEDLVASLPRRRARPVPHPAFPESLAYLMYTSGSTGRPKGVGATREGLAALGAAAARDYGIRPDDRVLQFSTLEFDISVEEVAMTLEAGAALVLRPPALMEGYDRFREHCAAHGATVLDLPTGFWRDWVREMGETGQPPAASVRLVVIGGEGMEADALRSWQRAAPAVSLVNSYGPTEATVTATRLWAHGGTETAPSADFVASPIGSPLGGATVAVLDPRGRPLPPEIPGELHLGGTGVARGYPRRPALTALRFVPDPAGAFPGARCYRTGDVGYAGADGSFHFVGRADLQVKVRGFRVELEEVEAALLRCSGVRRAVVTAGEVEGRTLLRAFLVADDGAVDRPGWEAGVRRELEEWLPAYMVPARVHRVDEIPATPAGKPDRRALERLGRDLPPGAARPAEGAPDPLRDVVLGVFEHVLGTGRPDPGDDFFALGGDSLLAMRVAARLREALSGELSVREIFAHPRLGDLVAHLRAGRARDGGGPSTPLPPDDGSPALSSGQERLWMAGHLSFTAATYNVPAAVVVRGPFDVFAFEQSMREVQRRHQVLRTRIALRERRLVPLLEDAAAPLVHVDAAAAEGGEPEVLARLRDRHVRAPFDLERDPPLRMALLRVRADEHHLWFALHHVAADGRSIEILIEEFLQLYEAFSRGLPSPLPEPPIQYGDFARREKARLTDERRERLLGYWTEALRGAPERTALPFDFPRPSFNEFRGGRVWFDVPAGVAAAVRRLCLAESVTPFMALLAAYKLLLHRHSGETDVVVGTPVSTRDWSDTEPLIGLFVNQLVLRTDLAGSPSFRELLRRVRTGVLAAYHHRELPFEELVAALRPRRTAAGLPLVQTVFAYSASPWRGFSLDGLELEFPEVHNGAAKYDLEVQVMGGGDGGMRGYFEYGLDLFTPATIRRLAGEYVALLAEMTADPDAPAGPPGPAYTDVGEEARAPAAATRSPEP